MTLLKLVHFAHGLVENSGDDAAVTVSGRPGVAVVQAEAANEHFAFLIKSKFQVHAGQIVRSAGKAEVLARRTP